MSSDSEQVDSGRRHFLLVATTVTGIAGAAMTAVPFLASWKPSARAQALGAPVEQDISKLELDADEFCKAILFACCALFDEEIARD